MKNEEELIQYTEKTGASLACLKELLSHLNNDDHQPIIQLLEILLDMTPQVQSDNLKERQETLILFRESYAFLKLYLFHPEQVKYFLEHDLNQTYFLKNILN